MAPMTVMKMTSSGTWGQGIHGGENNPTKNMMIPTRVYTMIVFQFIAS